MPKIAKYTISERLIKTDAEVLKWLSSLRTAFVNDISWDMILILLTKSRNRSALFCLITQHELKQSIWRLWRKKLISVSGWKRRGSDKELADPNYILAARGSNFPEKRRAKRSGLEE